MEKKYDVVIIGAGPAGLSCAYLLKKNGYNVAVIEKKKHPRNKLCGGLLSHKTKLLLEMIFGDSATRIINASLNYKTKDYEIYFKKKLIKIGFSKQFFYLVERTTFDFEMFKCIKREGIIVIENEKVLKIDNNLVITNKRIVEGKVIIGADGINSVVRKQFDGKVLNTNNVGLALESKIEKKMGRNIAIIFGYNKQGYCWFFPNKNGGLIGSGGLKKKENVMVSYKSFCKDFIKNNSGEQTKAFLVPLGNYVKCPFKKNHYLIGDAAGLANPLTGEGIYYALLSAKILANAMSKKSNCREIGQNYCKEIYPVHRDFNKIMRFRSIFYALMKRKLLFSFVMKALSRPYVNCYLHDK